MAYVQLDVDGALIYNMWPPGRVNVLNCFLNTCSPNRAVKYPVTSGSSHSTVCNSVSDTFPISSFRFFDFCLILTVVDWSLQNEKSVAYVVTFVMHIFYDR